MRAAVVVEAGKAPIYDHFKEPVPTADDVRVSVSAAALSNVVKSRASGKHYSSSENLPFVVGIDGVGRLDDGRRVYFALPKAPFGSMSERTVVPLSQCVVLPDALDDVTAAALANPGMSSWAALSERARLAAGETVLVNGATGTAGRLAVQIAKHMGAKKVIATGRNTQALDIGSVSGPNITLPSAALRSSAIELTGSGIGSIPLDRLIKSVEHLMQAAVTAGFAIETKVFPLSEVETVWGMAGNSPRAVFQIRMPV
ncbi:MAG: zinc-binding alcohol dehydrogenase family protein [Bryobacteraceae bacterium]